MSQALDQLRAHADELRTEVQNLESDVAALPGQLAEISRRLQSSTDEKVIRTLQKKRSELLDEQEVKPLLLRGARIRWLRAKAAHARAEGKEIEAGYAEALAAERDAKAELDAATRKFNEANTNRLTSERRSAGRATRASQLDIEADELEAARI